MKKYINVFAIILFSFVSFSFSINIITREQRGADENLKYASQPQYQKLTQQQKIYIENLKKHYQQYQNYLKKQHLTKLRNQYLEKYWLKEIKIDKVIEYENGNKLWWPFQYHYNKDRIVIHHTANDYTKFKNQNDIKKFLRGIYRYHAFTKGWGDLGYHYIIDPRGNIYEGRAGGKGIVGAHAIWNNTPSIGIALIGNFETQKPTKKQLISLIKLILYLSKQYNINPTKQVYWHKTIQKPPYIKDLKLPNIVGHRDVGYTACPGKNLYTLLPKIRQIIKKVYPKYKKQNTSQLISAQTAKTINISTYLKNGTNKIKISNSNIKPFRCLSDNKNISIISCYNQNNNLTILYKTKNINISSVKFIVYNRQNLKYIINVHLKKRIQKQNNQSFIKKTTKNKIDWKEYLQKLKKKYLQTQNVKFATYKTQKIQYKISPSEAKNILNGDISVLLYELTKNFNNWDIQCKNSCKVNIDGNTLITNNIKIYKNGINLITKTNGKTISANKIEISDTNDNIVIFTNYSRKSFAGIPWNSFKGKIIIQEGKYKDLNGNIKKDFVVINKLSFKDYLLGIAESNDNQPLEKSKALAEISKIYTIFYMKNKHPNIPSDAGYNAIDDPRIFQKYVGAGFEKTSKTWPKAVKQTWNWIILYNNYIPILPYFNCSPGFTFSAEEKFGWIDTPYLISKIDFYKCKKFNGHGVGLSGKGAEVLAKKGINWQKILKYYYNGIEITKIQN